jgi:DNA-binding response OmpR family regulator
MLETSVLLASSAEVALRMTERTDLTIDLMLIDVVMPDLSGPDLVERVLAIRPHQTVLFMSGFTEAGQLLCILVGHRTAWVLNRTLRSCVAADCHVISRM